MTEFVLDSVLLADDTSNFDQMAHGADDDTVKNSISLGPYDGAIDRAGSS